MYVYVASSWRCVRQPGVVTFLRAHGIDCYDFTSPEESLGFTWTETGLVRDSDGRAWADDIQKSLVHPRAEEGFASDFNAMQKADACVLVLPCNRSAHLELGWFVGQGKPTAIFLESVNEPELMYKMVDLITDDIHQIVDWLRDESTKKTSSH
jgi:hypothetical protein